MHRDLMSGKGLPDGLAPLDGSGLIPPAHLPQATETTLGGAEIATQAETDAGVDDLRIVTPLKLATALPTLLGLGGQESSGPLSISSPVFSNVSGMVAVLTPGTYLVTFGMSVILEDADDGEIAIAVNAVEEPESVRPFAFSVSGVLGVTGNSTIPAFTSAIVTLGVTSTVAGRWRATSGIVETDFGRALMHWKIA